MNDQETFQSYECKVKPECYIANYQENPYNVLPDTIHPFYEDLLYGNSSYCKIPVMETCYAPSQSYNRNEKQGKSRSRSPYRQQVRHQSRSRSPYRQQVRHQSRSRSPYRQQVRHQSRSRSRSRQKVRSSHRSRSRGRQHFRHRSRSRSSNSSNIIKQMYKILEYPQEAIVAAYNKASPYPVLCCYGKLCRKRFCIYSHVRPIQFICTKCPIPMQFVNAVETKKHMFIFHQFDDNKWRNYTNITINPPSGKN